ncbi:polyamine aminopropyltransferase [Bacillus marinisedimentorum]|uniref:polyamine aminopropyltransferase n=1 Tax=Bacillus marinisedimentorum TaxID=1821260 RepID=UPI0007DFEB8F|nr:polyamine aminopropyltransferase [Bacillus marinisedimentorum]
MSEENMKKSRAIYWASGIVSICGIIFEVLFGALGSYMLGDGVKQYTLTISLFLTGMGIGASLSENVTKQLIISFIWIEFTIGLIGGMSAFLLFGINAYLPDGSEALFLYGVTFTIGALTGVELPVLIRKADEIGVSLNKSTARVLFSDYAGGLVGGLLFVFLLRPQLGLVKTAFMVALVNIAVAVWVAWLFREEIRMPKIQFMFGGLFSLVLAAGLFFGEETAFSFEQKLYSDPIIFAEETEYQRIILTKEQGDIRMYLDGSLQFSSSDEYRYHETLVHPAMEGAKRHENVLILGGGDGMALREVLKYKSARDITLVDLDPAVVELAKSNRDLRQLNANAFDNTHVEVVHKDAFRFLESERSLYDVILIDLPDPNNEGLNKLYTREFYSLVRNRLSPGGMVNIQATSPVFAPRVYWGINSTIASAGLKTENLHVEIPSFGNWGFILAGREPVDLKEIEITRQTRFLTTKLVSTLAEFGKDENEDAAEKSGGELPPNTLINPYLIEEYEKAWLQY